MKGETFKCAVVWGMGYCELNFENGNRRLSRILFGRKDLRGKKVGKRIVYEMTQLFFEYPKIDMFD